jgi:hypothetical protein
MVTLVIIGLMTSAVIMNLPKEENPVLVQGRKIAHQLDKVAQASLVNRQTMGVMIRDKRMDVVRYEPREWKTVQELPYNIALFSSFDFIQNGTKIDLRSAAKLNIPLIRYDVTGLATPFEIRMSGEGSIRLVGKIDGSVVLSFDGQNL